MTHHTGHTGWCAQDHRCNLTKHRSEEIIVNLPGYGRAVLVRVHTDSGTEHAELRLRVALAPTEPAARRQLAAILTSARNLVTRAAAIGYPRPERRTAR
ncbi:hypothetical protein [Plantactinospora soyae]|uniref:Uncharacterized protein n=1 Tax=Plantactinospora soyae TaxID=1544732 RepID=A0A927QV22_9ACTN|nr:hypothetical protein [Plantactinospora soyae]MBE1485220.1 hypothetical protein [Plantactinospora soyae]